MPVPSPLIGLILLAMAVARLSAIVTLDEITYPARAALIRRLDGTRRLHRWAVYLFGGVDDPPGCDGCPWCVSVWISAGAAPLWWYHHDNPVMIVAVTALALAQAAGMINTLRR